MREAAHRMDPDRSQIQIGQVRIGAVAQLVERVVRNDEVWGSIPHSSTTSTLKRYCGGHLRRLSALPVLAYIKYAPVRFSTDAPADSPQRVLKRTFHG
jgi:hypothetical protein